MLVDGRTHSVPIPKRLAESAPRSMRTHHHVSETWKNSEMGSEQADVSDIKIRPILLHKGNVRLAIYGLGNIRDERLVQTFKANKVRCVQCFRDFFGAQCLTDERPYPLDSNVVFDGCSVHAGHVAISARCRILLQHPRAASGIKSRP